MTLSKKDFLRKMESDSYLGSQCSVTEELPLEEIERVTAGIETKSIKSKEEKKMYKLDEVLNKTQYQRVKEYFNPSFELTEDSIERLKEVKGIGPRTVEKVLNNCLSGSETNIEERAKALAHKVKSEDEKKDQKQYFNVDVNSNADVRGVKFKGHTGIEITDFSCTISTKSNTAIYNHCEIYRGNSKDNFTLWGRYRGQMKRKVNNRKEASFEFYLRGNNLTVTYWQGYKYRTWAKQMARRAIELLKEALLEKK